MIFDHSIKNKAIVYTILLGTRYWHVYSLKIFHDQLTLVTNEEDQGREIPFPESHNY